MGMYEVKESDGLKDKLLFMPSSKGTGALVRNGVSLVPPQTVGEASDSRRK